MNASPVQFKAPWGKLLIGFSIGVVVIILGGTVGVGLTALKDQSPWVVASLFFAPLVLVAGALFTIRGYEVSGDKLRIRRLLWWTEIPLSGLQEVRPDPEIMNGLIRTFGNGGMFSFSGFYYSKRLGKLRLFVTDFKQSVLLKWKDKTIAISPDQPDKFVQAVSPYVSKF